MIKIHSAKILQSIHFCFSLLKLCHHMLSLWKNYVTLRVLQWPWMSRENCVYVCIYNILLMWTSGDAYAYALKLSANLGVFDAQNVLHYGWFHCVPRHWQGWQRHEETRPEDIICKGLEVVENITKEKQKGEAIQRENFYLKCWSLP